MFRNLDLLRRSHSNEADRQAIDFFVGLIEQDFELVEDLVLCFAG